ncbi:MAG: response regulator [Provencibacterium sp.]|jgi:PAS domain S-box-containing protein|nr:response regulator [Provencibacterium sp.]
MNEQQTERNLMENILSLLNRPNPEPAKDPNESGKQAEETLSASPDLRAAQAIIKFMDEMPGGFLIYYADDTGSLIHANRALLRIFQCDTMEDLRKLTGNSFKGMVHPEDRAAVEQSIWEQISHSQYDLDYVEYRIIRKDGVIRWLEDYGHFIHSESVGDIFYVFVSDATEKKKRQLMEKAAVLSEKEQSQQKLQDLMEEYDKERDRIRQEHLRRLEVIEGLSINYDSILYADLDEDTILPYRLSSRTKRQFDEDFQLRSFVWYANDYIQTWVHPEDREMISRVMAPDYIREKLSSSKTYYINYRVLYQRETQYLQLRIVNVGNNAGNGGHVSQIVLGHRRIDEEFRREMEQKQMLEEALNNANLAIVAKNTFLSNMSHDIRTPLNAIFGFTALIKKNTRDMNAVRGYLDKIEASSKQLLNLIDKVLELSWTESKDHVMEAACSIPDTVEEIYQFLLPQAAEKDITFFADCTALKHRDVYTDPERLKQLLLYLANNAVTYTEPGGRVDIIATELETLPGNRVAYQFVVKDTGIGISKDFLQHIFEPFEREQNTTLSGIHGIGLGLTIAKNIVEMMEGTIAVDSTVGQGSTFTATLHFHIQDQPLPASGSAHENGVSHRGRRILVVEDNEINLEIETEILQEMGFDVATAADGSIAVEMVKNAKPGDYDLILTDIQMPVMNGWQAAQEIRKLENPALACIPIVALSANAFESDRKMSLESGMEAHLTKPIDIPMLTETITRILQR